MSSDHQEEDLTLKSPVIIHTPLKSYSNFNQNESNSPFVLAWGVVNHRHYHLFIIIIHF